MKKEKLMNYWIDSAQYDYKAMNDLYKNKNFHWALFMGHLVIEKLLKAYYVKTKDKEPPFIHNLSRIAEKAELPLTEAQLDILDTITTFNIRARYDDYKLLFYKKCTPEFTKFWIEKIEDLIKWIKTKL